ncbi:hypothetical protein DPMN_192758 [Dreissena polymorpha]|uniref:Uncharacterized protein n=1 Tax=Dreissena polymorpha TaxID=45954 RepID=A0A9D3XYY3_DREPO|nr:hypothetical protein DPMN_192758 [Dreissena polymorpha]
MVTPRSFDAEFSKLSCWPSGAQRTFSDDPGPIEIDMEQHGGYTVYMPDRAGLFSCSSDIFMDGDFTIDCTNTLCSKRTNLI